MQRFSMRKTRPWSDCAESQGSDQNFASLLTELFGVVVSKDFNQAGLGLLFSHIP